MVPSETFVPRAKGRFTSPDGGVARALNTASPANSSATMAIPRIVFVSLRFIYASLKFDQFPNAARVCCPAYHSEQQPAYVVQTAFAFSVPPLRSMTSVAPVG